MGTRQDNQDNPQTTQPDFGQLPDLDDLLMLAEIDESDVAEALVWLEEAAPEMAQELAGP